MKDGDDGSPVSEAPIDEDEHPNESERLVEEPDLVTEVSREIESDQLRWDVCQSFFLQRKKKLNRG